MRCSWKKKTPHFFLRHWGSSHVNSRLFRWFLLNRWLTTHDIVKLDVFKWRYFSLVLKCWAITYKNSLPKDKKTKAIRRRYYSVVALPLLTTPVWLHLHRHPSSLLRITNTHFRSPVLWSYLHAVDLVIKSVVPLEKTLSRWFLIDIQRFPTSQQLHNRSGFLMKSLW